MANPWTPGRGAASGNDLQAWLRAIGSHDAPAAHQLQRALDPAFVDGIPVGQARELDDAELQAGEHAALIEAATAASEAAL